MNTDAHSNAQRQYLMVIDGEEKYLPLAEAGAVYDLGYVKVEIGGKVKESDGLVRAITKEERHRIVEIADEVSSSK